MKKFASLTIALGLMATMAATASAAEVTGTTAISTAPTESSSNSFIEPVITPVDIVPATHQVVLTEKTAFYLSNSSIIPLGWLSVQTIDTTGEVITDAWGNEWREIYTWLGKAWLKVPSSANVVAP